MALPFLLESYMCNMPCSRPKTSAYCFYDCGILSRAENLRLQNESLIKTPLRHTIDFGKKVKVFTDSNQPQYTGFIFIFGRSKSFILKQFFKPIFLDFKYLLSFHQLEIFPSKHLTSFQEVTSWRNTSKCASLSPDRILSVLLGVIFSSQRQIHRKMGPESNGS